MCMFDDRICRRRIAIWVACLPPPVFFVGLFRSLSISSVGFSRRFPSRSLASDLVDAGSFGWYYRMWPSGILVATSLIHCFPEGLLVLFDSFCFASISQVFAAGFSTTCTVRLLEVDVGSPRPINLGHFEVDGDEDWLIIAG